MMAADQFYQIDVVGYYSVFKHGIYEIPTIFEEEQALHCIAVCAQR